jgi:RNA polymerase sigma factor (TIGR02999 family)
LLVNDAFMRLLDQRNIDPGDRSEVLAAGATIIRRLLVDYARSRKAQKRGGDSGRGIALDGSLANSANQIDILELNEAMESLGTQSPRAARVVELKFFAGLTGEEVAEQLQVSLATVNNDWRFAKAWLRREIGPDSEQCRNDD